ncbi:hypothetical protein LJC57_01325 [Parabacteroides sp. OttesenSCG-928-G07]|nr:hypothetical protein [Parabacteroides sp. OttesenSCG-928-G07]
MKIETLEDFLFALNIDKEQYEICKAFYQPLFEGIVEGKEVIMASENHVLIFENGFIRKVDK